MALGCGVHVVSDADGLFEEALHAAEVDAAVDKVLHGAEMGGWIQSAAPRSLRPPTRAQRMPVRASTHQAPGGFHRPP